MERSLGILHHTEAVGLFIEQVEEFCENNSHLETGLHDPDNTIVVK